MSDLVEFWRARLDEDEQTARTAISAHEQEPRITPCRGAAKWSHRYDEDDYGGTEVVDGDGHVVVPLAHDSGGAVRIHVARLLQKLAVEDRTQAVIVAIQRGIVHIT